MKYTWSTHYNSTSFDLPTTTPNFTITLPITTPNFTMTSNTTSWGHYEVHELRTKRYQGHEPHFEAHEVLFKSTFCLFFPTQHLRFLRVELHPRSYLEGKSCTHWSKINFTILSTDITDQGVQLQFAFWRVTSGGSRIFLSGSPTPKVGRLTYFFDENCMKMKEFGRGWGGRRHGLVTH